MEKNIQSKILPKCSEKETRLFNIKKKKLLSSRTLKDRYNLGRSEVEKGTANRGKRIKFKNTSHIQRNTHDTKGNMGIWG